MSTIPIKRSTDAATAGKMRRAAIRATDDPVALRRAAQIVRAALHRRALTLRDLQGDIVKPTDIHRFDGPEAAA